MLAVQQGFLICLPLLKYNETRFRDQDFVPRSATSLKLYLDIWPQEDIFIFICSFQPHYVSVHEQICFCNGIYKRKDPDIFGNGNIHWCLCCFSVNIHVMFHQSLQVLVDSKRYPSSSNLSLMNIQHQWSSSRRPSEASLAFWT